MANMKEQSTRVFFGLMRKGKKDAMVGAARAVAATKDRLFINLQFPNYIVTVAIAEKQGRIQFKNKIIYELG